MASFLASWILHPERIVLPTDRQLDLRHLPPGPSVPAAVMARGWGSKRQILFEEHVLWYR